MDSMNLILCAVAAAALDICALVLLLVSYVEKKSGEKIWARVSADMELVENGKVYSLECDEILIGRHASADIRIADMSVSRYHAMLNLMDGKWTITDLDSKSGIYINGELIKHCQLMENDVITLGKRNITFRKRRI